MRRRGPDRAFDSDPATQGGMEAPDEASEPTGDPAGMHREDDIDRLLDREGRTDEGATVHLHDRAPHDRPADPQSPDELAADAIALATQGGGSFLEEEGEPSLEEEVDRDAMASGIVPQLVSQATLESASAGGDAALEPESDVDEDAPTLPRVPRPSRGRTGGAQRARRSDAR